MLLNLKIVCAVLNYQRLDDRALENLKFADLDGDTKSLQKFKDDLGIDVSSIAVIKKCNAVMVLISYQGDMSTDHVRGRLISTWDQNSKKGIMSTIRDVKVLSGTNTLKFLAECVTGIHSVTIGDSQVAAQINDSLLTGINGDDDCLKILAKWLTGIVDEARLKTNIFDGNISLERIACELISKNIPAKTPVMLIGYGKSGKLISKILNRELNLPLYIVNRTPVNIEKEKFDNSVVKYLPLHNLNIPNDVGCVVIAINNNEATEKLVNNLLESIKDMSNIHLFDLTSPPLVNEKISKCINLKELSKIAESSVGARKNEINKVRNLVENNLDNVIKTINQNIGRTYIYNQKKHTLKLDKNKLTLVKQRGELLKNIRNYLNDKNFVEVSTPHIVGLSTDPPKVDDGGTINVNWMDSTSAFLRQSNQIYKQILVASGLDKVYEIGPFWRKEVSESYRHLQESIGLDIEFSNPKDIEEIYYLACSIIKLSNSKIIESFNLPNNLLIPEIDKIPVLTYHEAVQLLRENGNPVTLGDDLGLVSEAKLGQLIKSKHKSDIFVVKDYPDTIKKFYTKDKPGGLTETFDVIVGGWELVSGAVRQTDAKKIKRAMQLSEININDYEFYISIIDGSIKHGGFCIGVDRLIAKILNKEMVEDAVPFPRTYKKLIP